MFAYGMIVTKVFVGKLFAPYWYEIYFRYIHTNILLLPVTCSFCESYQKMIETVVLIIIPWDVHAHVDILHRLW